MTKLPDTKPAKMTIWTLTKSTGSKYTHWADGLSMIIEKGDVCLELNGDDIKQLVASLPKNIGGKY